jgi:hypothetical protein
MDMEFSVTDSLISPSITRLNSPIMIIRIVAIVTIVLGIIMMADTGFTFVTQKDVVDGGSLSVAQEKAHYYQWLPIAGAILVLGGVITLIAGARSRPRVL